MKALRIVVIIALITFIGFGSSAYAEGELEFGATNRANSTSFMLGFNYSVGPVAFDLDYNYGKANGEITTDQAYLNIGYDRDLSERWSFWGFNKSGYNNFMERDFESFTGFGPKVYLVKNDTTKLSMSVGYLYQYTDYTGGASESVHRMSYRPKFSTSYKDTEFNVVFFYQPSIADPDDYITIAEASVSLAIDDDKAFKLTVKDEYRSTREGTRHEPLQYITFGWKFE